MPRKKRERKSEFGSRGRRKLSRKRKISALMAEFGYSRKQAKTFLVDMGE